MTTDEHNNKPRRPDADNSKSDRDENTPTNGVSPDPFDPKKYAIDGTANFSGVKKALVHVPVRKPNKQEFFRVRPETECRMIAAVLEDKEEGETHLVVPSVAQALPGEFKLVELRECINRQGDVFIWAVPLPDSFGRSNPWHSTAREAAEQAQSHWVRMVSNRSLGAYDLIVADSVSVEPNWPEHSFAELLRVAFGNGRVIDDENHPIIQRLLGRA